MYNGVMQWMWRKSENNFVQLLSKFWKTMVFYGLGKCCLTTQQYPNTEVRKHNRHFLEMNFLPYINNRSSFTKTTREHARKKKKKTTTTTIRRKK